MTRAAVTLTLVALALMAGSLAFGFRDAPSQQLGTLSWRQTEILRVRARTHGCTDALGRPRFRVADVVVRGGPAYRRWVLELWRGRARLYCKAAHDLRDPRRAIRAVFGRYGDAAIRVARCETGGSFSVYARSPAGHLGLFQFGGYARSTYGFGWSALEQARAAYRMFRAEGWRPWQCAYIVGLIR